MKGWYELFVDCVVLCLIVLAVTTSMFFAGMVSLRLEWTRTIEIKASDTRIEHPEGPGTMDRVR